MFKQSVKERNFEYFHVNGNISKMFKSCMLCYFPGRIIPNRENKIFVDALFKV